MSHGWSGSTILGNGLGAIDGFVHVGELRTLWADGLIGGGECGCRRPIPECPFWTRVLDVGFGSRSGRSIDPGLVAAWHREATRVRHAPRSLARSSLGASDAASRYAGVLRTLYRAIGEVTGAKVIVDTSKRAGDAAFLRLVPGLRVRFVHLVRDSRAVAASWRKRDPVGHGSVSTVRDWVAFNLLFEAVRRRHGRDGSIRVLYEEFVRRPRATLRAIARVAGTEEPRLPLAGETTLRIPEIHTVLGNPARFATGNVELRNDEEWRTSLPDRDRRVVAVLSAPLLVTYGYPLGRPSPALG